MTPTVDKSALISLAKELETRADYGSLYEFGAKFISQMRTDNASDTAGFFEMITLVESSCLNEKIINADIRQCLGKTGAKGFSVRRWCEEILNAQPLRELSAEELHYVMGYAARLCRIAGARERLGRANEER